MGVLAVSVEEVAAACGRATTGVGGGSLTIGLVVANSGPGSFKIFDCGAEVVAVAGEVMTAGTVVDVSKCEVCGVIFFVLGFLFSSTTTCPLPILSGLACIALRNASVSVKST